MAGNEDHEESLDGHLPRKDPDNQQADELVPYTPYTQKAFDALHDFMNYITSTPKRSASERRSRRQDVAMRQTLMPPARHHGTQTDTQEDTQDDTHEDEQAETMKRVLKRAALKASTQADTEEGTTQGDITSQRLRTPVFADAMKVLLGLGRTLVAAAEQTTDSQSSTSHESECFDGHSESMKASDQAAKHGEDQTIDDSGSATSERPPLPSQLEHGKQLEPHRETLACPAGTLLTPLVADSTDVVLELTAAIEPPIIRITPPSREVPPLTSTTVPPPSDGTLLPIPTVIRPRSKKAAPSTPIIVTLPSVDTSLPTPSPIAPPSQELSLPTSSITTPPTAQDSPLATQALISPSSTATHIAHQLPNEQSPTAWSTYELLDEQPLRACSTYELPKKQPLRAWSTYELPQVIPGSFKLYMPGLGNLPTSYTVKPATKSRTARQYHIQTGEDGIEERHFAAAVSAELRRGGLVEPWI
ncbi:hypothetical protein AMS68_002116 [Peltaster fructicola]|uniref:Uncharacterized protein n=1 Tax=Peltaster fructicola TaxID=286661 RepID=A0A6H0XPQ0_9PEZI|nr:hypothetical protein AMS68_002116 [Peltaster fructicola]